MDIRRKANRESYELILQFQRRQNTLLGEELSVEKLTHLLEFINRLAQTPPGAAELQRRRSLFGKAQRIEGETSGQFYGRLRYWLDRDIPQAKSPLHA